MLITSVVFSSLLYYLEIGRKMVKCDESNEIQRFSLECRKTKTKVITLTNHNSHEPIRTNHEPIMNQS